MLTQVLPNSSATGWSLTTATYSTSRPLGPLGNLRRPSQLDLPRREKSRTAPTFLYCARFRGRPSRIALDDLAIDGAR